MGELILENISIKLGDKVLFDGFNYSFKESMIYLLTGPSGRGKSSLAKAISRHLKLSSGSIRLNNQEIKSPTKNIFLVSQQDDLFPWLTVREHLIEFGSSQDEAKNFLQLAKLDSFENYYPYQLSGGMKKRLALLRAQSLNSKVIILDETFSFIDQELSIEILKSIILKWKSEGRIIIIISHYYSDFISFVDDRINL